MLTKFYRIDEAVDPNNVTQEDLPEIISEIEAAVNRNGNYKFSNGWLAGLLQSLRSDGSEARKLVRMLDYGTIKDEDQQKTAINIKTAFDILTKYGFARKYGNDYRLSDDRAKNALVSVMRQRLGTSNAATRKDVLDKQKYAIRSADQQLNNEEEASLRQKGYGDILDVLTSMPADDISAIKYLLKVQDAARKTKKNYSQIFKQQLENNSKYATELYNFGFIKEDGTLNNDLIKSFIDLFNSDPRLVFKLNKNAKTIYDMLEKASADQAYVDNDIAREFHGTPIEKKANELLQTLTPKDKEVILNNQILPKRFSQLGLLNKSGRTNELYAALQVMLKRNTTLGDVVQGTKDRTGRDDTTGRLDPSHPTNTNPTHVNKLADVSRRFSQFRNR